MSGPLSPEPWPPALQLARRLAANVARYRGFCLLSSLRLYEPVLFVFYVSSGLSIAAITALQALYSVAVIVAEIPTGVVADRLGSRASAAAGASMFALSVVVLALGHGLAAFACAEVLGAIGYAFVSGADATFLHDTLRRLGREREYVTIEAGTRGLGRAFQSLGNLAGGALGSLALRLPLVCTAASFAAAAVVMITGIEPGERGRNRPGVARIIADSAQALRRDRTLRWLIAYFALMGATMFSGYWLLQPLLRENGLSVFEMGLVFSALGVAVLLGSRVTPALARRSRAATLRALLVVAALALVLAAAPVGLWVVPVFALFSLLELLAATMVSAEVLARAPAGRSATLLSAMSMARRLVYAAVIAAVGVVTDAAGTGVALLGLGGLVAAVGTWLWLRAPKL
ncbi:MFS transporter [Haliangium sp.]|uniref:MFS transporter n=1 Tax=Haliangium sp. TaxID=2663208 RepID=UPI003D14658A